MIITIGINDMRQLLKSKDSPCGQNYVRHFQVLQFLYWQRQKPIVCQKNAATNVATGYGKGHRVMLRILANEKEWIQSGYIAAGHQGKNNKMRCMLEDEGTQIATAKYICGVGDCIFSLLLYHISEKLFKLITN
jgi:hypothetical protein